MKCIVETASKSKAFLYCRGHALRIDSVAPGLFLLTTLL